ncbi:MAG: hypothetical protein ACOYMN_15305 [Roseimicrobium sp.]
MSLPEHLPHVSAASVIALAGLVFLIVVVRICLVNGDRVPKLSPAKRKRKVKQLQTLNRESLNPAEIACLHRVLRAKPGGYVLSRDFRRGTEEHAALHSLRERLVITTLEGGKFEPGKKIVLTHAAHRLKGLLEAVVCGEGQPVSRG